MTTFQFPRPPISGNLKILMMKKKKKIDRLGQMILTPSYAHPEGIIREFFSSIAWKGDRFNNCLNGGISTLIICGCRYYLPTHPSNIKVIIYVTPCLSCVN